MKTQLTFEKLPEAVQRLNERFNEFERLLLEKTKDSDHPPDQLLTVKQTAIFLSLSVPAIYALISRKELPVMKRQKLCYFFKADLLSYLKTGRKSTNQDISDKAYKYLATRTKKIK